MLDIGRSGEVKDVIINNFIFFYCEINVVLFFILIWYKDGYFLILSDKVLILLGG